MKIWDISQVLRPGLPLWPGEPPFEVERVAAIGPECPVNVGYLRTPLHAGAHADSPLHYSADGRDSAASGLDPYLGPCKLFDLRHARGVVRLEDIAWNQLDGAERVLLRTYQAFPHDAWDPHFTAIDAAVIERLGAIGVKLIGVDAPSLDPQESKTMDAHKAVLAAGMQILEGLVLDDVPPGDYELIALPLKLAGADASPVRAVLRELPQ